MDDRKHDKLNAKIRALVDDALAELVLFGLATADQAAKLMAIQSLIRIEDQNTRREIAEFATSLLDPDDD